MLPTPFYKEPFCICRGNEGVDSENAMDVPAIINLPNTIIVGASNNRDEKWEYSNFGDDIDVFALGENIETKTANNQPYTGSGTSLATPFVTAWIAKKLEEGKSIKEIKIELKEIKYILKNHATNKKPSRISRR